MVLEVGEIDELVKLEFPTYSGWVAQSDLRTGREIWAAWTHEILIPSVCEI
jgi:hypothetical protein